MEFPVAGVVVLGSMKCLWLETDGDFLFFFTSRWFKRARRVIGGLACSRTPRLVGVNICTGPSLAGRQRHVTVHFVSDDIDDSNVCLNCSAGQIHVETARTRRGLVHHVQLSELVSTGADRSELGSQHSWVHSEKDPIVKVALKGNNVLIILLKTQRNTLTFWKFRWDAWRPSYARRRLAHLSLA